MGGFVLFQKATRRGSVARTDGNSSGCGGARFLMLFIRPSQLRYRKLWYNHSISGCGRRLAALADRCRDRTSNCSQHARRLTTEVRTAAVILHCPLSSGIIEHASVIPIGWKNCGAYGAALIRRAPIRGWHRARRVKLPYRLTGYSTFCARVKHRRRPASWSDCLRQEYRNAVLPAVFGRSALFHLDHISGADPTGANSEPEAPFSESPTIAFT